MGPEASASRLEVRMYLWKAEDRHLPRVLINESLKPASAAVVATPILKLCPLYCDKDAPVTERALRTSLGLDRGIPSS